MEKIDLFAAYLLGAELHPISKFDHTDKPAGEVLMDIWSARDAIAGLLQPTSKVKIGFAKGAADELRGELDRTWNKHFTDGKGHWKPPATTDVVPGWTLAEITRAYVNFRAVLRAELEANASYQVQARGIFDVAKLVEQAQEFIHADIRDRVNAKALDEYMQAGKCLAFGLFTASGYHACRALEAVIEDYHTFFAKTTDLKKSWWEYIDTLGKIAKDKGSTDAKPNERTLMYLNQTKDAFRNGIMHPRYVLSDLEAETFFTSVKCAITAMAMELGERDPKPTANALADMFGTSGGLLGTNAGLASANPFAIPMPTEEPIK
jgi:hypothetical protein